MTSIIKVQPFSGVEDESPPCYLLQVDDFRFLLDCGWTEDFDMTFIDNIKKQVSAIDAILLSYPDPQHLGALPYLVGKCGLNCPIYATIPVYKMGQMFMYDLYQSHHNIHDFKIFTLDDVDAAFDKVHQLKYSQTVTLKGRGHGLTITPLPAGHMIGGTIWKIVKDGEEEIVYAIDYNHKKERHLNGCVLDTIVRPSLLITDAFNAEYSQARRRLRDEKLMTTILQTMRNDGNVLITVDTAGRSLELAHLLDQMWRSQESGLAAYSLALINNVSYNVVEFAKSQVEWMSDKIMRAFEDQRNNPFQFKHLQLCHSLPELSRIPDPKVVLASCPDMECGFSRDLFLQWCGNHKNAIILTNRTSPGTLARRLIESPNDRSITLKIERRVKLEGTELEEYLAEQKLIAARKEKQSKQIGEVDMIDDSEDSEDEEDMSIQRSGNAHANVKHDIMRKPDSRTRTGFFKQTKKTHLMFPFFEEKLKWDDYGEFIKPEDYIIVDPLVTEESSNANQAEPKEVKKAEEKTEAPTKCVTFTQKVNIEATISFIDFEGRSDGESIRKLLTQIRPRQLVLVHGSLKGTQGLAEFCRSNKDLVQGQVLTPRYLQNLDATSETQIYQVRLKDSVVTALKLTKARETELSWIDAVVDTTLSERRSAFMDESMETDSSIDLPPTLIPLPANQVPGHDAVFINEPRLSDFKLLLLREGFQAEFQGGVLICNNIVAIRRHEGKMLLEGPLCEDYYKVRTLLYSQYAIL